MSYLKQSLVLILILFYTFLNASNLERTDYINQNSIEKNLEKRVSLTKKEKEYLKQNIIKIGMIKDYYPFSYEEKGEIKGFSYEYFKLLASKVDMQFEVEINNWSTTLNNFKDKKIDIIDAISYTKQREEYTNFLDTYFEIPNVIFARENSVKQYKGIESLKGKKVGITKGIYYFEDIKKLNLFELVVFENSREKIKALAYGKIDAAFNNLSSGHKYIIQGAYANIYVLDEISNTLIKKEDLRLGVSKENQKLFSILQKATNLISPTEKLNLINKYFASTFQKESNFTNTLKLTKEERDFLRKHPNIVLGTSDNWAPSSIKNKDGTISGYDQDILDKINKATGANFVLKLGNWVEIQELAKKRELDGLATLIKTEEREKLFNFTKPYIVLIKNVLVKNGNPSNIQSLKDLEGKTVSIHKGNLADEKILSQIKNVNIIRTDSILQMLNEVIYKDADATFGNGATEYMITQKGLPYLTNAFAVDQSLQLRFAIRNDWPEAISIMKKGLSTISEHEKVAILQKWFGRTKENKINFNEKEREYLNTKKEITMCVDPNFLPYEKINKDGKYIGVGAQIIEILSKSIEKPIVLLATKTWTESIQAIKDRKCDILPLSANTPSRRAYMNFTKPYIEDSLVVATNTKQFFVKDSSDLSNRKIGIIEGYSYIELLKEKNPKINIITVKSAEDGLKKVQNGELFGYVDALSTIAYAIQKHAFVDLKVAGNLEFDELLSLASRNDEPLLNNIMQKALDEIGEEQIRTIIGRWISIQVEQSFDYRKLIYISLFFLITLILVINRNRTINKFNNELEASNKEIEEKNRLLEKLAVTDNLTKLYNRNKLDEALINETNRANRDENSFGIILVDIDYFKKVNDKHGHIIGDTILKEFAKILESNSRKIDIVGRWGGEEFLILCPQTDLKGVITFAESLRERIEVFPFSYKEQKTASFGVAVYKKEESINELIKRADYALYKAKKNGRNRVES